MSWRNYLDMSTKQRRALARKAVAGNKVATANLLDYTRSIKKEVNRRLASLEKAGLNYGSTYNNITFFLETEYDSHRMQSPTALDNDPLEMSRQNEIGAKFLERITSTVSGMREAENRRLKALQDLGAIPSDIKRNDAKKFIKFLGNEEISAAIDEYGESETIVEMMYDAYSKEGVKALDVMQTALTEFLSQEITFDDAMERVGIKVEDYYRKFQTS